MLPVRFLLKDPLIRYPLLVVGGLVVAQFAVLLFGLPSAKASISLHYTTYLGVDWVGLGYLAYLLPVGSLILGLLNTILAYRIATQDKMLAYLLVAGSVLVAALGLLQVGLLVVINR